jgi:hypothetical protein
MGFTSGHEVINMQDNEWAHLHECLCRGCAWLLSYPFLSAFAFQTPSFCFFLLLFLYDLQVPLKRFQA